jgi:hypothetical protein
VFGAKYTKGDGDDDGNAKVDTYLGCHGFDGEISLLMFLILKGDVNTPHDGILLVYECMLMNVQRLND